MNCDGWHIWNISADWTGSHWYFPLFPGKWVAIPISVTQASWHPSALAIRLWLGSEDQQERGVRGPPKGGKLNDYRRGAAASIERDFLPGHNENPSGREGRHVFEVLPDVLGGSSQDGRVHGLSVIDLPPNSIVHICPKWSNEGPPIRQGKGLRRKLAH